MIGVGTAVTLPDSRQGRIVSFTMYDEGEAWEARVVVDDDPDPYVVESESTMWLEHVIEEAGMCTSCDLRTAIMRLVDDF